MPHQFMSINCENCGEWYCPVCEVVCPECGKKDTADTETMNTRRRMREQMNDKADEMSESDKFIEGQKVRFDHIKEQDYVARIHEDDLRGSDVGMLVHLKDTDQVVILRYRKESDDYVFNAEFINKGNYEQESIEDDLKEIMDMKPLRDWGTVLDSMDKPPARYVAADFFEMSYGNVKSFLEMSNLDKFKYAYWAQKVNTKRAAINIFLITSGLWIIVILLILLR